MLESGEMAQELLEGSGYQQMSLLLVAPSSFIETTEESFVHVDRKDGSFVQTDASASERLRNQPAQK